MQTVQMSHSHAMIILCGVCAQSRQCLAPASVEQSGHCVMCRPAAVIMPITTSAGQIGCTFYGGNQKSQTGRGELALLHSCRVRQLSSEERCRLWFSCISCIQICLCYFGSVLLFLWKDLLLKLPFNIWLLLWGTFLNREQAWVTGKSLELSKD